MKTLAELVQEYEFARAKAVHLADQIKQRLNIEAPPAPPPAAGRAKAGARTAAVLALAREQGTVTAVAVAEACGMSKEQADAQLRAMVRHNTLVRVGRGEFAAGSWARPKKELAANSKSEDG